MLLGLWSSLFLFQMPLLPYGYFNVPYILFPPVSSFENPFFTSMSDLKYYLQHYLAFCCQEAERFPATYGSMHGFMSPALTSSIFIVHHFSAVYFLGSLNWAPPFALSTSSKFLLAKACWQYGDFKVWNYQAVTVLALVSPPLDLFFTQEKWNSIV